MSPADRERAKALNVLDCVQETVLRQLKPWATDEYSRHHNTLISWFSDLLDRAQEKILKARGDGEEEVPGDAA